MDHHRPQSQADFVFGEEVVKKIVAMSLLAVALTGCNSTKVTGTGDFFALTQRNVAYRDLTRPVSYDNEPEATNYVVLPYGNK